MTGRSPLSIMATEFFPYIPRASSSSYWVMPKRSLARLSCSFVMVYLRYTIGGQMQTSFSRRQPTLETRFVEPDVLSRQLAGEGWVLGMAVEPFFFHPHEGRRLFG